MNGYTIDVVAALLVFASCAFYIVCEDNINRDMLRRKARSSQYSQPYTYVRSSLYRLPYTHVRSSARSGAGEVDPCKLHNRDDDMCESLNFIRLAGPLTLDHLINDHKVMETQEIHKSEPVVLYNKHPGARFHRRPEVDHCRPETWDEKLCYVQMSDSAEFKMVGALSLGHLISDHLDMDKNESTKEKHDSSNKKPDTKLRRSGSDSDDPCMFETWNPELCDGVNHRSPVMKMAGPLTVDHFMGDHKALKTEELNDHINEALKPPAPSSTQIWNRRQDPCNAKTWDEELCFSRLSTFADITLDADLSMGHLISDHMAVAKNKAIRKKYDHTNDKSTLSRASHREVDPCKPETYDPAFCDQKAEVKKAHVDCSTKPEENVDLCFNRVSGAVWGALSRQSGGPVTTNSQPKSLLAHIATKYCLRHGSIDTPLPFNIRGICVNYICTVSYSDEQKKATITPERCPIYKKPCKMSKLRKLLKYPRCCPSNCGGSEDSRK